MSTEIAALAQTGFARQAYADEVRAEPEDAARDGVVPAKAAQAEAPEESAADGAARVNAKQESLLDRLADSPLRPFAKLSIEQDEKSGAFVYKVIDSRSGDVVRQWPREEALAFLGEGSEAEGLVVDRRV